MYSLKYLFRVLINDQITKTIPANEKIAVSNTMIVVMQHLQTQRMEILKSYRIQNS